MSAAVIRLPTAARRQPPNHRFAAQCHAARELRLSQPWPGKVVDRYVRQEAGPTFEVTNRTPELLIVMALVKVLTPEQRLKAANIVHATNGVSGDHASREASAIMAGLA